jgi:hypothetical protein
MDMYAMTRSYAGGNAHKLYDVLMQNKAEVEGLLRGVKGLSHYDVIKTSDGCVTVTMCEDKAGADQSWQVAKTWLKDHTTQIGAVTPVISEGPVSIHI